MTAPRSSRLRGEAFDFIVAREMPASEPVSGIHRDGSKRRSECPGMIGEMCYSAVDLVRSSFL
jgi:hypothetical protein